MTSATRHRRLLLALASAMLATTIYGGLPIERPKRKLRMVEATPEMTHPAAKAACANAQVA